MSDKCDICGEKVKNGVCTGCGMDYNSASTASAETFYEQHERSDETDKDDNENDMFSMALEEGLKKSERNNTIGTIVAVVFITVISVAVVAWAIYNGMFDDEKAERAAARASEQALTERPRISIPRISIPKVNIPKITVPNVDLGEDFQKAIDHDIQAIIGQNGMK